MISSLPLSKYPYCRVKPLRPHWASGEYVTWTGVQFLEKKSPQLGTVAGEIDINFGTDQQTT
jgi:hypothetical protein